jgi:hypothetical protein
MKRSIAVLLCGTVLALASMSAAWAVWEGNAGIAGASEFPGPGLFARSDLFPRNTIVEIINLEKDITTRVVITGPSGVPGVVAILSPEAAAALNIKAGTVNRVRISVPPVTSERPAPGTVRGTEGDASLDPDVNPAAAVNPALPLSAIASPGADPLVPLPAEEEPTEETLPVAEPVQVPETVAAEEPAEVQEPAASNEIAEETPAEMPEKTPADIEAPSSLEIAGVTGEPVVTTPVEPEPEPVPEPIAETAEVPAAEPVVEPIDEPIVEPESAETEEIVTLVPAEPNPPETLDTVPPESDVESPGEIASVSEPVEAPETPVGMTELGEPAVPEAVESPRVADVPATPQTPKDSPVALPPAQPIVEPIIEEKPVVAETATKPPVVKAEPERENLGSIDLPYVTSLVKGGYYIQIASYADPVNAARVVAAYGKKYPVAVERSEGRGGTILKVYIGPVKKDEFGAVLERFRQNGFKDAFVKKVQ